MNSYLFDIGDRPRKVSRFIAHVCAELQRALVEEKSRRKISQQSIAKKLGINRSVINRQFIGEENLTLRSIAELAWALDWEPDFRLRKNEVDVGQNDTRNVVPSGEKLNFVSISGIPGPQSITSAANIARLELYS